jgi:succinate dehydrogenase flavin-adding protein (antitoxin of CptAB toxin-antitoxin module)
MIVYCTQLWLGTDIDSLLGVIGDWLSRKLKTDIDIDKLIQTGRFDKGSMKITVEKDADSYPQLIAFRLTHPDSDVSGRRWITELGMRKMDEASEIEFTVLLQTDSISILVDQSIQPTRPYIVQQVLERCYPTSRTVGTSLLEFDEHNADSLWELINDRSRTYPLVIISPTPTHNYIIPPEDLHFQLKGVAQVAQILPYANTYRIEDILTRRYTAFRGAINIVFSAVSNQDDWNIPNRLMRPEELEEISYRTTDDPAKDVLAIVAHRVNLPNKWRHISPEAVRVSSLKRRIDHQTSEFMESAATAESKQMVYEIEQLLSIQDQELKELTNEKTQLQKLMNFMEGESQELKNQIQELETENKGLKTSLAYVPTRNRSADSVEEFHSALVRLINQTPTLEDSLLTIQTLFPNRVLVLNSAFESAHEAQEFKYADRAFDLLWKLVTDYWEALKSGKGDTTAKDIFGDTAFAPTESETVKNNRRARELRTFVYEGEHVEMLKHLIIGVKPSKFDTMRTHFHWDARKQIIVIGHCGKHLDHS